MPRINTKSNRTLIVIPALNEAESIEAVLSAVRKSVPRATVLVIDDGSTDLTATKAASSGAIVISLPFNLGVGGAMRVGFAYAQAEGFRQVVQVDADGQHEPENIPALLQALRENDVVLGSRFTSSTDYQVRGPRKWAMLLLAKILSRVSRTQLTDTTSGFRASGPRAIDIFVDHYPAEYLGDTVESLVIAARAGLKICEVPVSMNVRQGGTPSHNPFKSTIFLARVFLAVLVALLRPPVTVRREA